MAHGVHGTVVVLDNRRMAAISGLQLDQYRRDFATHDEVAVDYAPMTQYAKGVLKTNLRRLDTANKVRFIGRSVKRRVQALFRGKKD